MSRTTLPLLPIISLLIFSLPLVILATFTTFLAFSTLAVRVLLVYLEMGIALLQSGFATPVFSGTSALVSKRKPGIGGRLGADAVRRPDTGRGLVQRQRGIGGPWSAI